MVALDYGNKALVWFQTATNIVSGIATNPPCMSYSVGDPRGWVDALLPGGHVYKGALVQVGTSVWRLGGVGGFDFDLHGHFGTL